MSRIMKSKYVQSDLKYIFDVLAEDLEKGRPVLFTGTPCQVVAVCQFADGLRLREKLYTMRGKLRRNMSLLKYKADT